MALGYDSRISRPEESVSVGGRMLLASTCTVQIFLPGGWTRNVLAWGMPIYSKGSLVALRFNTVTVLQNHSVGYLGGGGGAYNSESTTSTTSVTLSIKVDNIDSIDIKYWPPFASGR